MTREQFDARWKEGSKRWQGGGIGLSDCMWATFYREFTAKPPEVAAICELDGCCELQRGPEKS